MGSFTSKKSYIKILLTGVLLLVASMSVSAQNYGIGQFLPGTNRVQWKWMAYEFWNSSSESWNNESSTIYQYSGGTSNQPAELIIKTLSKDDVAKDFSKYVYSYANGKVQTATVYTFDTVTSSYKSTPYATMKVTWTDNLISKLEMVEDLELVFDMVNTSGMDTTIDVAAMKELSGSSDLGRMITEMVFNIVDGKVVEELTRAKVSTNPLILPHVKDVLSKIDFPADTNWTDLSKSVITHRLTNRISNYYEYVLEEGQMSHISRDSLVLDGEKVLMGFSYNLDTDSSWNLFTKDSLIYDSEDKLLENVTTYWTGLSWENFYRSVYHYTDYPASAISFPSNAKSRNSFKANISRSYNKTIVNFSVDNNSTVAIQLCNLQGKTIGRTIRNNFSAGSHFVTLDNLSQGKYICKIQTETASAAIPFQVVR